MKVLRMNFCIAFTFLLTFVAFAEGKSSGDGMPYFTIENIQQERTITGQVIENCFGIR